MVVLEPVPLVVIVPGYIVSVHVPVAGSPDKFTLPVVSEHVGGVIVPTDGLEGVSGCGFISTSSDCSDVQA